MIFCSGVPNGEAICGNPVLRGITPLRCADHHPKSPKLIIEALTNVGIDLPLTSKSVPKLSLLISETIREIQMKRKLSIYGGMTAPFDVIEMICLDQPVISLYMMALQRWEMFYFKKRWEMFHCKYQVSMFTKCSKEETMNC